jgi:PhnB protein
MPNTAIELIPYLSFDGNCEDALNFYKEILDGRVEIITRYDNPAMPAPEEYRNKVLHARFYFGNQSIFASDVMPGKSGDTLPPGKIALSLGLKDEAEARRIFDRLAEGGRVGIPFKKQFWGDWHGNLVDRYGVRWMLNAAKANGE